MSPCLRWVTTLGMAILMLGALASPAVAQGGGSLPAYGEPTIISGAGVQTVYAADFTRDGIPDIVAGPVRNAGTRHSLSRGWATARSARASRASMISG